MLEHVLINVQGFNPVEFTEQTFLYIRVSNPTVSCFVWHKYSWPMSLAPMNDASGVTIDKKKSHAEPKQLVNHTDVSVV